MNLGTTIDSILVLILLLNLALLAAGRLATCINIFAAQCLAMSVLPIAGELMHGEAIGWHGPIMMLATIALKVLLIPWVLKRTIRTADIHREVEPFIGFTASVLVGSVMIAASFAVGTRLQIPGQVMSNLLVPAAVSTLMIGLLVLITRSKAITQVLAYLVMENGVYLFGLSLLRQMPLLVELSILLDVFVGVFVMAIVVYHIRRAFDHIDTHVLDQDVEQEKELAR
jgi:hydrogenase-4 component E